MPAMNTSRSKWMIVTILTVGSMIGMLRGTQARQKWVFKMKNRYAEKRLLAEQKKLLRNGGVVLDDIELAAFHK